MRLVSIQTVVYFSIRGRGGGVMSGEGEPLPGSRSGAGDSPADQDGLMVSSGRGLRLVVQFTATGC